MSGGEGPRPPVREDIALMEGYHSAQVEVAVRLNTNEAAEPPPASFVREVAAAIADVRWNRYPDRSASKLRSRIATLEGVRQEQVFAANGSNEVLQCLCLAYAGAGRSVVLFEPTYALHAHIARLSGATVVTGARSDDFRLDLGEVRRVISETSPAITFLCSPNNPTGLADSEAEIREVAALVEAQGGLLVVDEAYGQFASWSAVALVDEDRPVVVTRTYSKTWSMAAARLGYMIGPSWAVADLEKVVLPYHLSAAAQIAGEVALDHVGEMEARVAGVVAERDRIVAGLGEMDVEVWPSDANFVLFKPRGRSGAEVWSALVERSVLVRDCSSWPGLEGCLRVTVGTSHENDAFLAALEEALEEGPLR